MAAFFSFSHLKPTGALTAAVSLWLVLTLPMWAKAQTTAPVAVLHQQIDSLLDRYASQEAATLAQKALAMQQATPQQRAKSLYFMAEVKMQLNQMDSSRYYMRQAVPFFQEANNIVYLAKAYEYIAKSMMYQTYHTDSSLKENKKAVAYAAQTDSSELLLNIMSEVVSHFTYSHRIDSALYYLDMMQQEADKIEDLGYKKGIDYLYWSLYRQVKDFDKAMEYLNAALQTLDTLIARYDTPESKNQTYLKGSYYDFGIWTFNEAKRYRESVDWAMEALRFKREHGIADEMELLSTYDVLAVAYYELGLYDSAQYCIDSCLQWASEFGRKEYEVSGNVLLGKLKASRGEDGLQHCEIANDIDQYFGGMGRKYICECFYEQHKALGNKAKAFDYLDELNQINDSLKENDSYQQLVQLEQRYQYEKQKQEIEQEKVLAQLEAQKQKRQGQYLLGGIGLLALSLGAGGIAFRKTRKYNRFLSEEDQRKDALMQEVHHRTNNSLQLISALLTMQGESVADKQLKQVLKDSESRIHSLSTLHQMLQEDAAHIQINMEAYLSNIADFHAAVLPEYVDIKTNFSRISLPAKTAMPLALIANELITNSLKYAFPNAAPGTIYFALNPTENGKEWVMEISDNGVGIAQSNREDKTNSSQIGTKLLAILVRQIGATMDKESNNGTATLIRFSV